VNPKLGGLARIILTPGMWLQRLTTAQPNDEQLEVSCEAMRAVLAAEDEFVKQDEDIVTEPVV
jgi:uncharacterized protein YqhQ